MTDYDSLFAKVSKILEETLENPVDYGLETDLMQWISVASSDIDAFLAFTGFERIGTLEIGSASVVLNFILYIRKFKTENRNIPNTISKILSFIENNSPIQFAESGYNFVMEIETGISEVINGIYLFTIPIKVHKVGKWNT